MPETCCLLLYSPSPSLRNRDSSVSAIVGCCVVACEREDDAGEQCYRVNAGSYAVYLLYSAGRPLYGRATFAALSYHDQSNRDTTLLIFSSFHVTAWRQISEPWPLLQRRPSNRYLEFSPLSSRQPCAVGNPNMPTKDSRSAWTLLLTLTAQRCRKYGLLFAN